MKKNNRDYLYPWLNLLRAKFMGSGRVRALEAHFGSIEKIFSASAAEIASVKGFNEEIALAIREAAKGKFDHEIEKEFHWADKNGVSILIDRDPEYPEALRHIPYSPLLLYTMGEIRLQDILAFAIVGTRKATDSGRRNTGKIACELAEAGLTIVSGLAWGIDDAAHKGALRCKTGRTIAVLGSGLKCIYPKEHIPLADQMRKRGAVVTELFTDVSPQAKNFPPRNRIISGLSLGVLIAEAPQKSGALITAQYALEQGKEIYAIPGAVDNDDYAGTNNLIKESAAKLVTSADEILADLADKIAYYKAELEGKIPAVDFQPGRHTPIILNTDNEDSVTEPVPESISEPVTESVPKAKAIPAEGDEATVLLILNDKPTHIDILCRDLSWPFSRVSSALSMLELKGLAEREAGMRFRLVP